MKRLLFISGVIALVVLGVYGILNNTKKPQVDSPKISVVTTLFPLYDFAKNIGQDKIKVMLLIPPGVEAHSFEPKPSDIAKISEAGVFIYTGKFMEPWAEDVIRSVADKNVKIVDASIGIKMIPSEFKDEDGPALKGTSGQAGSMDPHIWLDFDNDKKIVETISDALSEKDPANASYYRQNADEYQNNLSTLDAAYKTSLAKCKLREIVYGGHYAFGYLAKRYNLKYFAAQGVSQNSEPTARELAQLVEQIKTDNIKYIFYEELSSPKIAQILANETKAKLLLLNAAHNVTKKDFENNVSFMSIMKNNLTNLKTGLEFKD